MPRSELNLDDFARLFGTPASQIPPACEELIGLGNFEYEVLRGSERDQVLSDTVGRIESGTFSLAGPEGKSRWERGWAENRDALLAGEHEASALVPRYIRPAAPLRLDQEFILAADPQFELNWYVILRKWLSETYLSRFDAIYEFGCGSGFNLAELAGQYPRKTYLGLDWAQPSVDIINELGRRHGWDMHGKLFDFFSPDVTVEFPPNSVVLTIGALEQTGQNFLPFLDFLLASKPSMVIHIEPIVEWYDRTNVIDDAAIRFHAKRKYWMGYPAALDALNDRRKIEILKKKRSYFGSQFIEGYSQLIWRPLA